MAKARAWLAPLAVLAGVPAAAQSYPDVVAQSRYVAVRDGTRLAVSIYRPATGQHVAPVRLPVVFAFTP